MSESFTLEFEDLYYEVPSKREKNTNKIKKILHGINGRFRPGKLTAVIGPSGSGKSSLLNVLSGFKTICSKLNGKVLINGKPRSLQDFKKQSSYVKQESVILPMLTVLETLQIAALFKLPSNTDALQRKKTVDKVANVLGLENALNTKIKFLSGGEKKRVSIGVELISNPPIMFLDEPTSGLDSSSSLQIMIHMKKIAQLGHTIIVVIHQPSSRIFKLFDDVYLISKGHCLYNGSSDNIIPTLAKNGFNCPQYYNISDFAIEVACNERGDNLEPLKLDAIKQYKERSGDFYSNKQFELDKSDETAGQTTLLIEDGSKYLSKKQEIKYRSKSNNKIHSSTPCEMKKFWYLLKRCFICQTREMRSCGLILLSHTLVATMMGFMYYDFGSDADKVVPNSAFLFCSSLYLFFCSALPAVITFPVEANQFQQEHLNNWYSVTTYYFAKIIADIPYQILFSTVYLLISYYLTGQPMEVRRIYMLWLICIITAISGQAVGSSAGTLFNVQSGVFVIPAITIPMYLLAGFFQKPTDMLPLFYYLSYLSFAKYSFEATIQAVFGYNRETLSCSKPYCYFIKPEKFISYLGMKDFAFAEYIFAMLIWVALFQIILLISLKLRIYKSQR